MKKQHRRFHIVIWLLLTPVMFYSLYHAAQGRLHIDDAYQASEAPVQGVAL